MNKIVLEQNEYNKMNIPKESAFPEYQFKANNNRAWLCKT